MMNGTVPSTPGPARLVQGTRIRLEDLLGAAGGLKEEATLIRFVSAMV